MPWRGVAPVQLVIAFVGAVLTVSTLGIILLAAINRPVPDELATVAIASMTGLAGLLSPNTGLLTSTRTNRRASLAGTAAAEAVIAAEADEHEDEDQEPGRHKA